MRPKSSKPAARCCSTATRFAHRRSDAGNTRANMARSKSRQRRGCRTDCSELRETKSTTRDGRHIVLSANIELPDDVEAVSANGAEGIGLYRTEFLYLNRDDAPERGGAIRDISQSRASGAPASAHHSHIRSRRRQTAPARVDVGDELNPFLGWRAIRFCLENLEIFKPQLRAILRASAARQRQNDVPDDLRAGGVAACSEVVWTNAKKNCAAARIPFNDRNRRSAP